MKLIFKLFDFLSRRKCECCEKRVKQSDINYFAMGLYGYEQICETCVREEGRKRGWY